MGFELNDRVMALNVQLQAFMDKHIYPREHDWHEWCLDQDKLWTTPPWYDELRALAIDASTERVYCAGSTMGAVGGEHRGYGDVWMPAFLMLETTSGRHK